MNLKNKNILITGASSGIGEALAKTLVEINANPILLARRENELIRVKNEILKTYSKNVDYIVADLYKENLSVLVLDYFNKKNIDLDVVIHNAGITVHGLFENSKLEVLKKCMDINFYSIVNLTQILLPLLIKNKNKKLIALVSSPSGLHGIPRRFAYSSSKAAAPSFYGKYRTRTKRL